MTLGSCSHRMCHHYQLEHLACADKNTLAFTPQWYEHLLVWRSWVQSRYFLWTSLCSFPLGENCHDELASILLCSWKERLRKMQGFWLNWRHYMIISWNWKTTCALKLVVMFQTLANEGTMLCYYNKVLLLYVWYPLYCEIKPHRGYILNWFLFYAIMPTFVFLICYP